MVAYSMWKDLFFAHLTERLRQICLSAGGGIFGFRCLVKLFGRDGLVAFDPELFAQRTGIFNSLLYPLFSHVYVSSFLCVYDGYSPFAFQRRGQRVLF